MVKQPNSVGNVKQGEIPNVGQKSIKRIEEEHFPILCSKLDAFKDELGLLEAFIAGLIASHDYSIISMIFRKVLEKKHFAEKIEMNDNQKFTLYWDLYLEMTKAYKFQPAQKFEDRKRKETEKQVANSSSHNKQIYGSDDEEPESLMIKPLESPIEAKILSYPKMEKLPVLRKKSSSSYLCSDEDEEVIDTSVRKLREHLGTKYKNQNQAVDELDLPDSLPAIVPPARNLTNSHIQNHGILEADEDAETLKISDTLLRSSASYRNKIESGNVAPNPDNTLTSKDISLTNEVFGSANCHNSKNGSFHSEDELANAVSRKQESLTSKREKKALEKLNEDEDSSKSNSVGQHKKTPIKVYKRPKSFA